MGTSKFTIIELREILEEDYKLNASFEEAAEIAGFLVSYFDALVRIEQAQKEDELIPASF